MRIDKPICKYGEANCRKHFDGNCMVENDFELRCPIERTINEVLEITDRSTAYIKKLDETFADKVDGMMAATSAIRKAVVTLKVGDF